MKKAGRPSAEVAPVEVLILRRHPDRYTWPQIAERLKISRATAIRLYSQAIKEHGGSLMEIAEARLHEDLPKIAKAITEPVFKELKYSPLEES